MKTAILTALGLAGLALAAACMPTGQVEVGRALYDKNCAVCHGADARGDGPAAAGLPVPPPDLTQIAARRGGTFDRVEIMTIIDGYRQGDRPMPEFPEFAGSETVLVETEPGILTPTPDRLVALADYLESIQR